MMGFFVDAHRRRVFSYGIFAMIRLLKSSALYAVLPFLAAFALAYHCLLRLISFTLDLAGLEMTWPPALIDDLEAEASALPASTPTRSLL